MVPSTMLFTPMFRVYNDGVIYYSRWVLPKLVSTKLVMCGHTEQVKASLIPSLYPSAISIRSVSSS